MESKSLCNTKKIKNIIVLFVIILSVSYFILSRNISDLDEIWNYNTARAISEGNTPYKEVSMITTPLLPIINAMFLKIFPNELFTMRILAITLISGILFLTYCIFKRLKINESLAIFSIFMIGFLLKEYICIDYNFFVLFMTLLIIFLECSKNKRENLHEFIIGTLGGICAATKQTTGMLICIAIVGYKFIFMLYEMHLEKKINKKYFKQIGMRILGILMPIAILLIYLLINNAFKDFLDYCVLGIKTFSNKIPYIKLIQSDNLLIKALSILIPISIISMFILSIVYKKQKLFIITCLGIAEFVVAFPISDNIHFLIGATPTLVGITYVISKLIGKIKLKGKKKVFLKYFFKCVANFLIIITFASVVCSIYIDLKKEKNYCELEHLKYIEISEGLEKAIKAVDNYIENNEKDVYILNFDAALYMIPINRYNRDYDMFLKGNIGSKGEEGQIEKIKSAENAQFLIIRDGINRNWQNPEKVRKYIKENLNKVGNIENFDIYEN